MNSKNQEVSCLIGWSASEPEENLTPKVSIGAAKMLHTSRLYLKAEATKTESNWSLPARTDLLSETLTAQ
jgi:hypothetical protein